jgi:hypothetical protein
MAAAAGGISCGCMAFELSTEAVVVVGGAGCVVEFEFVVPATEFAEGAAEAAFCEAVSVL